MRRGPCRNNFDSRYGQRRKLSARVALAWGWFLTFTAMGLVVAYCGAVSVARWRRLFKVPFTFIALATMGVVGGVLAWGPADPDAYIFDAYAPLLNCLHDLARDESFRLANWGNALLVFVTLLLIGSVWQSILDLPDEIDAATGDTDAKDTLRKVNDRIVLHLYLGSALLMTSIVALYGYYSWPSAIVAAELDQAALRSPALMIAVLFGSVFTVVLVFVLGPAIWAVNNQALRIARDRFGQRTPAEAKDWLAASGLRPTGQQQGLQILAALGPLLTGPILQLMSFVG